MTTTLTTEAMKAKVRAHFEEFVNRGHPEVIEVNMTPDFVDHDGPAGAVTDVSGDEAMMRAMLARIPDLAVEILDLVAEGDRVVCRNVWRWRDPSTGAPRAFQGFVCWRFEGDRIAERWATVTVPGDSSTWLRLDG